MIPQETDITITRGNGPLAWRFLILDAAGSAVNEAYMSASEWRLRIEAPGMSPLVLTGARAPSSTPVNAVDVTYTVAQSRLIPSGSVASYELERRAGGIQQTVCMGRITAAGGINDD